MSTRAGARNVKIVLERASVAPDDYTSEGTVIWSPLAPRWAKVVYGTGAERREAAQTASSMPATIIVLADSITRSLSTRDRITIGNAVWDIAGAVPSDDRADIILTAVQGQDRPHLSA